MSLTLEEVLQSTREQYKLKLLAGEKGIARIISWALVMEDKYIAQYFLGNELVVTSCLGVPNEEELMLFVQLLIEKHAVGIVINTGGYIFQIPQSILDYCNAHKLPLLTMPWEMSMNAFIRNCCMKIFQNSQQEEAISKAFLQAIQTPGNYDLYSTELAKSFHIHGTFTVITYFIPPDVDRNSLDYKRAEQRVRNVLIRMQRNGILFFHDYYYILIVNEASDDQTEYLARRIIDLYQEFLSGKKISIGVGLSSEDVKYVANSYRRAKAAMRMAIYLEKPRVHFSQMGFYQVLFSVDDPTILLEFSRNTLKKLTDYDKRHGSSLTDTLEAYLKYDCSVQLVSENTFTHRNTINYRIKKIKELLDTDLESVEEKFTYLMAFHIRNMMQIPKHWSDYS